MNSCNPRLITPRATTAALALLTKLLKLLPLLRRQHSLQTSISMATNLIHPWLHLAAHPSNLLARVAEDLLHFRLLIRRELQTF